MAGAGSLHLCILTFSLLALVPGSTGEVYQNGSVSDGLKLDEFQGAGPESGDDKTRPKRNNLNNLQGSFGGGSGAGSVEGKVYK